MPSGQQIAEANFTQFVAWSKSKSDADFRDMVHRGKLSRTEIEAECGFAKSALRQNPRIKKALKTLEDGLRNRGVLPAEAELAKTDPGLAETPPALASAVSQSSASAVDLRRLARLEVENAGLKAEVGELKRQLVKFAVIQEVLSESGRMPR